MKSFVWRDCIWLLHSQPSMVKVALEKSRDETLVATTYHQVGWI